MADQSLKCHRSLRRASNRNGSSPLCVFRPLARVCRLPFGKNELEIISALIRRVREGTLPQTRYREAKSCLTAEVSDATIINLIPDVVAEAVRILETSAVRALDALHIACALQWNADLFVLADERQLSAARRVKLQTIRV